MKANEMKCRVCGTNVFDCVVHRSLRHAPYNGRPCDRTHAVYLHPQPEQPASAVDDKVVSLIVAGENEQLLDAALQVYSRSCMYGTKSQHEAAMNYRAEILRRMNTQSPAVSPPSVVAVAPKVAVSEEDVEGMAACLSDDAAYLRSVRDADFTDVADNMERASAALESFASRMGSAPEGFVLVPKEPTPEMDAAGKRALSDNGVDNVDTSDALLTYKAMLAAAPQPTTKKG